MQTFLPFDDFRKSATVLDWRRLGKQRLEARSIMEIINGRPSHWRNHPAVRMWDGHTEWLEAYYNAILAEWVCRGYRNTLEWAQGGRETPLNRPWWLGDPAFHASHRAALLAKHPDHYMQFGWTEAPEINYVWPEKGVDIVLPPG